MKLSGILATLTLSFVSSAALAQSLPGEHKASVPAVNVQKIVRSGNRMPLLINPGEETPARQDDVTLQVRVQSGGCTSSEDFRVDTTVRGSVATIKIVRLKQDFCEAYLPEGTNVQLSTKLPASASKLKIANPSLVIENYAY